MKFTDLNTLLNTLVIGVVAYLALKAYRSATGAIDNALAPVAQSWFDLTAPPPVQVMGRMVLPGGNSIAIADIVNAGGRIDGRGFFQWQGTLYQVSGRNPAGDYTAVRIIT